MKFSASVLMVIALTLGLASVPVAGQTRAELKERFKERFAELAKLKEQGRVGETWHGYVEALHPTYLKQGDTGELVEAENSDRRRLYQLIAADVEKGEQEIPATKVAERNARRNFRNAQPDEYLLTREGVWIQKRDESRYERLSQLKDAGRAGETWRGTVEAVKGGDGQADDLLSDINRSRKKLYERLAKDREASVDRVAEDAGSTALDNVRPGQYYLPRNGDWERKPQRDRD